jgi:hypothetical protein
MYKIYGPWVSISQCIDGDIIMQLHHAPSQAGIIELYFPSIADKQLRYMVSSSESYHPCINLGLLAVYINQ